MEYHYKNDITRQIVPFPQDSSIRSSHPSMRAISKHQSILFRLPFEKSIEYDIFLGRIAPGQDIRTSQVHPL